MNAEPNPDIDSAITIWVVLVSLLLAIAAYLFYQAGQTAIGVVLGVISFIGVNIPTVGYPWWRRRQRAAKVTNTSDDNRAI